MAQFSVRDVLWLVTVVAFAIPWYSERAERQRITVQARKVWYDKERVELKLAESEVAAHARYVRCGLDLAALLDEQKKEREDAAKLTTPKPDFYNQAIGK